MAKIMWPKIVLVIRLRNVDLRVSDIVTTNTEDDTPILCVHKINEENKTLTCCTLFDEQI